MYRPFFKRASDLIISIVLLVFLMPLLGLITILLLLSTCRNPFFVQKRPGKNGRIFRIIKFKTMNDLKDSNGEFLPDDLRLTKVGLFIRRTSLDELPQLLNVVCGHMSLIGPRPLLIEYLPLYDANQKRRHEVRPGITGWAQVNGRNAISWEQKLALDVWYVDHLSLLLDLKIIIMTFYKVIKREGINAKGSLTIDKFKGNSL
ncbi:MAG: sugar transferase [Bacteroidetes bacterium]|nr:sugar transferase [Bacteroidota bacterium]